MGNLSLHFDKEEFRCQCGCGGENPSPKLIEMLEKLHDLMGASAIIISSGYRCPNYSVQVGGYRNDAHTCNIAVDCCVKKPDGSYYTSSDIAEAAERVGFEGIGIIDDTYCHLDTRGYDSYVNSHWWGDERTGNDNISSFQRGTVFPSRNAAVQTTHKIKIYLDDNLIWEGEVK